MKTGICIILAFLLGFGAGLVPSVWEQNSKKTVLQCDEDGNFAILVVSDPQCSSEKKWREARDELEILVERIQPDFVLINGDMNGKNQIPAERWDQFIAPLTRRNIYWAVTNGNHDPYKEKYYQMYKSYEECLNEKVERDDPYYEEDRPMNYVLPVYDNEGRSVVFAIYGMDTGTMNQAGYEGLTDKQINWYQKQSNILKQDNNNRPVISILAVHIPLPQVIDMYYSRDGAGAAESKKQGDIYPVYGFLNAPNGGVRNYVTENGTKVDKSWIHTTAPENDRGMFQRIQQQGDIKAVIFGHDHQTNFIGSYKGILLGFAGKISSGSYSDTWCRGGRVIRFNQKAPEKFTVSWQGVFETSKNQPPVYSDGSRAE